MGGTSPKICPHPLRAILAEPEHEIAGNLQTKTDRASIIAKLREKKTESDRLSPGSQNRKRDDMER